MHSNLIIKNMKKIYSLFFVTFTFATAFAQYVPFTGTGTLNANGWTTHSGTAAQLTILTTTGDSGNSLAKAGFATPTGNRAAIVAGNGEDVNFPFTAPLTGVVYYSFLVKYTESTTLNLNSAIGDYSFALTSVAGASTTAFHARVYSKQGATPNTVSVGVLNNSGGTAAPSYTATSLAINTTHLLVVKYDIATNTASLFVNPTPGSAEPTPTATNATGTTTAPTQSAGYAIRQAGTATAGTGNAEVDEFRVGTTFSSVTPNNLGVNQNSIAGLNVYPNPVTNGTLNIISDANAERNVVVYDVLGKQVLKVTTSNSTINVANLNAGIYIVKVTEEGKTATRKLVIR